MTSESGVSAVPNEAQSPLLRRRQLPSSNRSRSSESRSGSPAPSDQPAAAGPWTFTIHGYVTGADASELVAGSLV
ncbi:MAG: hypothetical protein R2843_02155 [Thermomicrobiales bacterium]